MGATRPDFEYDVFVSYSSKDQGWVRDTLVPTLEKNGIRVIIDYRDFEPGAPSVTEMERAVMESRKTIVVLTQNYVASAWSQYEGILAATLDPAGNARRIIPVLLMPCSIPLRLGYLTYLDFSTAEKADFNWNRLIASCSPGAVQASTLAIKQPELITDSTRVTAGLPANKIKDLRTLLLKCDELSSDALLRSLFGDPRLFAFRSGVPEAFNLQSRVSLLMDYLIRNSFNTGESLLVVFLLVLRERMEFGDARSQCIDDLLAEMGIKMESEE